MLIDFIHHVDHRGQVIRSRHRRGARPGEHGSGSQGGVLWSGGSRGLFLWSGMATVPRPFIQPFFIRRPFINQLYRLLTLSLGPLTWIG